MAHPAVLGIRSAQLGLLVNAALAGVKLVAGLVGNSYALVADAIESTADVLASIAVWGGLAIAAQPADEDHPYGHGKAEPLAASAVALMLLGAAVGIAIEAIQEIRTPHGPPAAWTLGVLVAVVLVKGFLSRRVFTVGTAIGSTAVKADAWHHLSDAVTSAAAFVGISVAVWGTRVRGQPGWAAADDWAALVATGVIAYNGIALLRPALHDLMDRMPGADVVAPVRRAAESVPGVLAVEKLHVRRAGLSYSVTIHVQADPHTPLDEAHALGHRVTDAIRAGVPQVEAVLVHMEPYAGVIGVRAS
jgi:cation diffusion facilitator family transporter